MCHTVMQWVQVCAICGSGAYESGPNQSEEEDTVPYMVIGGQFIALQHVHTALLCTVLFLYTLLLYCVLLFAVLLLHVHPQDDNTMLFTRISRCATSIYSTITLLCRCVHPAGNTSSCAGGQVPKAA